MHFAFVSETPDSLLRGERAGNTMRLEQAPKSLAIRKKKILLLSVSAGAGHIRAAEAISTYIETHHADAEARHLDVMTVMPAVFRKIYTDLYITLVGAFPLLWGQLYRATNTFPANGILNRVRCTIQRLCAKRLLREIALSNPDAIICTHFLPADILAPLVRNGKIRCPISVQVTDFDLHRMWVQPNMTGYFAATDEVAFLMRAQGIPRQSIHITGIPVMPAFAQPLDRSRCADEFGLDPDRTTLLLMGGGAGIGHLDRVAGRLLAMDLDFQLIVLAGKNEKLLRSLHRLATRFPGKLIPKGYVDRMERLMACADLAITKPGGLTIAECLAVGMPMILHSPIPGQEERNADYLLEQGVALKASDADTLEYRVRLLLESPTMLAEMRRKAVQLGRPYAARSVVGTVLRHT